MSAEVDTGDLSADTYHSLILGGLAMRDAGYAARRADILDLHRQGWKPPDIARELQRRACDGGCTEAEIGRLGISVHNVRVVLRGAGMLAGDEAIGVQ